VLILVALLLPDVLGTRPALVTVVGVGLELTTGGFETGLVFFTATLELLPLVGSFGLPTGPGGAFVAGVVLTLLATLAMLLRLLMRSAIGLGAPFPFIPPFVISFAAIVLLLSVPLLTTLFSSGIDGGLGFTGAAPRFSLNCLPTATGAAGTDCNPIALCLSFLIFGAASSAAVWLFVCRSGISSLHSS
jgi:hypothetical protein